MTTIINVLKNKHLPFLFAIPLFFSVYHYEGIVHDAVLYVTQYVYSINPLRFLGDPAFEFGNQDSLGFFSPIFGFFLEWFGVSTGAFVYTILMQFVWFLVAIFLVQSLLRRIKQSFWTLPVTILLPVFFAHGIGFSRVGFYHYIELYACSRSLSTVLGMISLIFLFHQKKILSLFFILAGTAIHPITAGWCLPFWMFYFFPKTRIPVLVISLLFPLTFLLHWKTFDFFPEDWPARPLVFSPSYELIAKNILFFVFFLILAIKSLSKEIRRISVALCLLIFIGFYWYIWGGAGEHVFLYQVQTWRVLWLPSIIAVPLGICSLTNSLKKAMKGKCITTVDLGVILLLLSFLVSRNLILISVVALVLTITKAKLISLKGWIGVFVTFLFVGFFVQQYLTWCLQGLPIFFGFKYVEIYRIRDLLLFYQFVFSVAFVVYFVMHRKFIPAIILVLYVFFSRFMLLPSLALFLAFFPKENKLRYWGGFFIITVLMLFDGLIDVETRRQTLIEGMCRSFPWISIASVISLASIVFIKKVSYWGIAVWLFICSAVAVFCYNSYSVQWQENESQLDQYLHESIFPQIKERGKMLFYVPGEFEDEPRLQFLTGSYLSRSTLIGSVFSREHYRTGLERSHLLYLKDRAPQVEEYYVYSAILQKIADSDTLIDRVEFLCGLNEISYLVTDKTPLPFVKEDSAMVRNNQKVFLYGCPSAD
jgi:hypothetical protein